MSKGAWQALAAFAALIAIWQIFENANKRNTIAELLAKNLEKDKLNDELQKTIAESKEIPIELKQQMESLIQKYNDVDAKVTGELISATKLMQAKEHVKAIFSLSKIVENLLKDKYPAADVLATVNKSKNKNPVFADYIEHAKSQKFLSNEEYHFANGLRDIRNQEGHELSVSKPKFFTWAACLTAVALIMKLASKLV